MHFSARPVSLEEIRKWRDLYRAEMNCQIVHDSLHPREGWALEHFLEAGGVTAGYGSTLIGGPWKGTRTLFEFYVLPKFRMHALAVFEALLAASNATAMEVQTSDILLTVMLHTYARNISSESIVFADHETTTHTLDGFIFRRQEDGEWVLETDGTLAATGGILYHYNRPYGDIYMRVEEPWRRRGLGAFLVQELKNVCYQGGSIPCARCNPNNIASRKTLQKAGFVPVSHILTGSLEPAPVQ